MVPSSIQLSSHCRYFLDSVRKAEHWQSSIVHGEDLWVQFASYRVDGVNTKGVQRDRNVHCSPSRLLTLRASGDFHCGGGKMMTGINS